MPSARTTRNRFHRVVLVPAAPSSSRDRGEELVRRYRLARVRRDSREATAPRAGATPVGG